MKHLDLFSGIGGFALAANRVWGDDYVNVGFCDNEPFAQAVLRKHWPNAKIYEDIKELRGGVLAQLTLLPEDSPASLSVRLGSEEVRKMTATSGRRCLELYERLLPAGSLVRMLAGYLLGTEEWYSTKCTLTWKPKVTKSGRMLFQLAPSVPRTGETGSGLLLTPTVVQTEEEPEKMRARAERAGYRNGTKWGSLASQIKHGFLPTPRVSEAEGSPVKNAEFRNGSWSRINKKGVRFGVKVKDVLAMLPMPRAGNPGSRPNGKGGKILAEEISKLLPTPTTIDGKGRTHYSKGGMAVPGMVEGLTGEKTGLKLQPSFALWMMGFPTDWCDLKDGEMPPSKRQAMP